MVGQRIGNYEIVQPLGEGGMATVYVALHPELGRRVAVKVMNTELAHSDEMVQRFFNEARAASAIGHRGIVEVSDLGRLASGAAYIVMELLEGESLAERLTRTGRVPLPIAAEIADQTADVMTVAHARGIVHRDLKPENLYLVPDPLLPGRQLVKVLDFGIAKLGQRPNDSSGMRTRTGTILGTPRYMSPEQCRDSRDVDHRADVYSLGVVLYEMLAGTPPFMSSSWGELAHMHLGVEPPALVTRASDIPARMAEVVHRALEKDPAARFQSMVDFRNALCAAQDQDRQDDRQDGQRDVRQGDYVPEPDRGTLATPAGFPGAGSTRRLATQSHDAEPPRQRRPTTLEESAVEVVPHAQNKRRTLPVVLALVAAVVVVGWLGLRARPTTVHAGIESKVSPAVAPVTPGAPTPTPPAPTPPPAVPPSATVEAEVPPADPSAASPAVAAPTEVPEVPVATKRRRSTPSPKAGVPTKPTMAPPRVRRAGAGLREPLKI